MLPMHPEAVDGCPSTVRWVIPAGTLGRSGRVTHAPGGIGVLLADGTLASVTAGVSAIVTELGQGHTWASDGSAVRTALCASLGQPQGWIYGGDSVPTDGSGDGDEELRGIAASVIAGAVGDLVRSHGGWIELVSVTDGVAGVRFHGSCVGCPAAGLTLHARVERELRQRFPALRGVRAFGALHGDRYVSKMGMPKGALPDIAG